MNQYYEYKDYRYYVQFEYSFSYTVICNGYEVCTGTSVKRVREKFQVLVDTGLVIKAPRVIGS